MKKLLSRLVVIGLLCPLISLAEKGYFEAIKEIQKLPKGAIAIAKSSNEEARNVIKQLGPKEAENAIACGPIIEANGSISAGCGGSVLMYKGDFDNSGNTEYLFLIRARSDAVGGVYKLVNRHLVLLPLDKIIHPPEGDLSQFHMNVAMPFAYIKDNKTYLRFMDYSSDYKKADLQVCTYLWKINSFNLIKCLSGGVKGKKVRVK